MLGVSGEITIAADFNGGMRLFHDEAPEGVAVQVAEPPGFIGSFVSICRLAVSARSLGKLTSGA